MAPTGNEAHIMSVLISMEIYIGEAWQFYVFCHTGRLFIQDLLNDLANKKQLHVIAGGKCLWRGLRYTSL